MRPLRGAVVHSPDMRLPDVLGVLGALVVGTVLAVFLMATALGTQTALPSTVPPSVPPLPTLAQVSLPPSTIPSGAPLASSAAQPLAVGSTAPGLQLTLLDGSVMNTADFQGTPMWVTFMTTWTPQSPAELAMETDYAKMLGTEMNEVVVDVGEDAQTVRTFMKAQNFKLPVALDQNGSAQAAWGAYALPVHYFLDADGVVQEVVYGGAPVQVFITAITAVVPDFSAEAPTTQPTLPLNLPSETPVVESTPEASATP